MRHGLPLLGALLGACVLAAAGAAEKPTPNAPVNLRAGPKTTAQLREAILAQDQALFAAVFDQCDADKVRALVTDDLEFFHDKDGLSETSGAHFAESIRQHCERVKNGVDFRARRELVRESLKVFPLNNYGAVETGEHRFYAIGQGKADQLTETAQFLHIWKNDNGTWKLARVVSYGHDLAEQKSK